MRKPELEPVIPTDTDPDTTPDIPADAGEPAASGGGHVVADTHQDPLEEVEAALLPQEAGGSGPQAEIAPTEAGGGAAAESRGGGAGEAPESASQADESSSLTEDLEEELTDTIEQYLQELDPQEVSDTMQSRLEELQQQDYSHLAALSHGRLSPEQADQKVHDLLTELQQVDYRDLTETLNNTTPDQIHQTVTEFSGGFADIPAGVEAVETTDAGLDLAAWFAGLEAADIDSAFNLLEKLSNLNDLRKFEHLLPGKFADGVKESIGLKELIDSFFKSIPGAVKDGKETPLSALARNIVTFFIGKKIGDEMGSMFRSVIRDLGVNPYEFSLRGMGSRIAIEAQKQATIHKAEKERDQIIDEANAEVQQAEDQKQAALDAYDTEQNELAAAENAHQQSIQQAERQQSEALAENERIKNETIQNNNAAAEEAKTKIQNGEQSTAFQNDISYQSSLHNSRQQYDREVAAAQSTNRGEVSELERQQNEALQTQQAKDLTALEQYKQTDPSPEDVQARRTAIERMEGQSYDNIRSQYGTKIQESNDRCAQACEQAKQDRIGRDLQATDAARDRANQKAEVNKTLSDRDATIRANNAKIDADSAYRDQCREAHDKRAQSDPVYHSCGSRQEIESQADANIQQKRADAATRTQNAQQACDQKCTQAEEKARQRNEQLDTKLENLDRKDQNMAPITPASGNGQAQGAAIAPVTPAPSNGQAQGAAMAPVPDSHSNGPAPINGPTHGSTGIVH